MARGKRQKNSRWSSPIFFYFCKIYNFFSSNFLQENIFLGTFQTSVGEPKPDTWPTAATTESEPLERAGAKLPPHIKGNLSAVLSHTNHKRPGLKESYARTAAPAAIQLSQLVRHCS